MTSGDNDLAGKRRSGYDQIGGSCSVARIGGSEPLRAFCSVVTKYSSRSRSNFSCVARSLQPGWRFLRALARRCTAVLSCPFLFLILVAS